MSRAGGAVKMSLWFLLPEAYVYLVYIYIYVCTDICMYYIGAFHFRVLLLYQCLFWGTHTFWSPKPNDDGCFLVFT